jgi:hypothetical protein
MAKMGDIWYPALLGLAEQYRYSNHQLYLKKINAGIGRR